MLVTSHNEKFASAIPSVII